MDVPGEDTDRTVAGKWPVWAEQSRLIRFFLVALAVFCLVIAVIPGGAERRSSGISGRWPPLSAGSSF